MTEGASCRKPLRALGSLRLGSCALETCNRRGQDKARKVRAVGRDGEHGEIPAIQQTLHSIEGTLRLSATSSSHSTLDTL
jgi:hypothetical protein